MSIRSESEEEITFETGSNLSSDQEERLFENSESDEASQASQEIETSQADEISEAMTTIHSIITKAPEFNGERAKYFGWEMEFMSYAEEKGFAPALLESSNGNLPASQTTVLDESIPSQKLQKKALDLNAAAMRALIGSLKSDHDRHKISHSRRIDATDWPNGKAWQVWKSLKEEYQPDDTTASAEMEMALHKLKVNKKLPPSHILHDIANIEATYGKEVPEARKVAIIMTIGHEYHQTISSANMLYKLAKSRDATSDELIAEMVKFYRMSQGGSGEGETKPLGSRSGTEAAFAGFKGKCNKCKKKGHKAKDCPEKGKAAGASTGATEKAGAAGTADKDKCGHCKKPGHKEENCWVKYPEKVPEWAKKLREEKKTVEASNSAATATEVLLCTVHSEKAMRAMNEGQLYYDGVDEEPELMELVKGGRLNLDCSLARSVIAHYIEVELDTYAQGDDLDQRVKQAFHTQWQRDIVWAYYELRYQKIAEAMNDPCDDCTETDLFGDVTPIDILDGFTTAPVTESVIEMPEHEDAVLLHGMEELALINIEEETTVGSELPTEQHEEYDLTSESDATSLTDAMTDDDSFATALDDMEWTHDLFILPEGFPMARRNMQIDYTDAYGVVEYTVPPFMGSVELWERQHEVALIEAQMQFPADMKLLRSPHIWIGDTGASGHCTAHPVGGVNVREGTTSTTGVSGDAINSEKEMDIRTQHCDKYGNFQRQVMFKDVSYLKGANYNLCSIASMLQNGWKLSGDSTMLKLNKGGDEILFDIVIKTTKGALYCGYFERTTATEVNNIATGQININVQRAHQVLGHNNETATRKIAAYLGWKITRGELLPCQDCTLAKAKQKNIPKVSQGEKATVPNGRVFLDNSTLRPPEGVKGSKRVWTIVVDEATGVEQSFFNPQKNDFIETICAKFHRFKEVGIPVRVIRMDNAGENKALVERLRSAEWQLTDIKVEYTARSTPQQNSLAERAFANIASRARALLNAANIPREWRWVLFPEAAQTITKLNWLQVISVDGVEKSRYEHFGQKRLPRFATHLRTWGEAGTVKIGKKNKVDNYGTTCVFIGYSSDHDGLCYRMWNPVTRGVHDTRDVIWLMRMYFTEKTPEGIRGEPVVYLDIETPDVNTAEIIETRTNPEPEAGRDEPSTNDGTTTYDDDTNPDVSEDGHASGSEDEEGFRKVRPTRTLKGMYKRYVPETGKSETVKWNFGAVDSANYYDLLNENVEEEESKLNMEIHTRISEFANVGAGIGGGFGNTSELKVMKYDEAINGPDGKAWAEEIDNEHERMVKNKAWEVVKREDVPKGMKIIDSTWACKKKSNGKLRGRLNARGFKQVEGVHYDGSSIHSPVTNAVTIRILLVLMILAGWIGLLNDVHGAFLLGLFTEGEQIYMEVPKGFKKHYPGNVVLRLLKCIYGLKQAAMAFWRVLLKCMTEMGMTRSTADPCLYFKWTASGLVMIVSWIDDMLIIGNDKLARETSKDFMSRFDCDDCGEIAEYVGCKIERKEGELTFTQPVLLQSFEDEFKLPSRVAGTPAAGGTMLKKPKEADILPDAEATKYRSGVGKLMYLMQYSRPEIYNAVRDLARHMKAPSQVHYDAMLRVMKYCVETPNRGLTLKPEGKWDGSRDFLFTISGRSDSDYAKCEDTRKSVSGYRVLLNGAPIVFKSATQKRAAQSVSEAELYGGIACAQEMLYAKHVLESMGLKVALPMELTMDNKGAVDHANGWSVGGQMRHIGTKAALLRELKESAQLVIKHIPGEQNDADLFTKNLDGPLFRKFAKVFVGDDEYMSK